MAACPCGSGQDFAHCCGPYLAGTALAPTAEALMRSRYTAYTRGDMAYLARSWDPATRPAELGDAEAGLEWLGLRILSTQAGQPADMTGQVEFVARYHIDGRTEELHEASRFRKQNGAWLYVDGIIAERPSHNAKTGRNDPCPCGSGKKFKKCCGA